MAGDFNRTINRLLFVIIVIYKKYSITYDIVLLIKIEFIIRIASTRNCD